MGSLLVSPAVAVRSPELEGEAASLGRLVGKLGSNVERLLRTYQMGIVDRQYQLGRVADAATEIYVSACVLNRLDGLIRHHHGDEADLRWQLGNRPLLSDDRGPPDSPGPGRPVGQRRRSDDERWRTGC